MGQRVQGQIFQGFALARLHHRIRVWGPTAHGPGRVLVQVFQQLALPSVPHFGAGATDVGHGQQIQGGQLALAADTACKLGDHLGVIEVFFLRHMAHGEVFADQELHQAGVFAGDLVGAAKPAHLHAALDRVVFAAPFGYVVEQGRHIKQPRFVPAAGQLRTKRVFMGVLGNEKSPHVAQHHEDVLIDGVDMEQVMLHLTHDAPKGPQITPQHRGLVHQTHGVGDAQG